MLGAGTAMNVDARGARQRFGYMIRIDQDEFVPGDRSYALRHVVKRLRPALRRDDDGVVSVRRCRRQHNNYATRPQDAPSQEAPGTVYTMRSYFTTFCSIEPKMDLLFSSFILISTVSPNFMKGVFGAPF